MPEETEQLAQLFRLASDPTRLGVLLILRNRELCVCSIAEELGVSVSAVSHQLRLLRAGNLVSRRRDGRHIYYTLADNHVETLVDVGLEHIRE
ncbi:transcriptional regulator [Candidatus Fermentibacteria bacterium]|nr:MAG: transcriptional regulator [Candidatus Fermentibacteria bacterium]